MQLRNLIEALPGQKFGIRLRKAHVASPNIAMPSLYTDIQRIRDRLAA